MHVFWPGVVSIGTMYVVIFLIGVWASRGRNTTSGDGALTEMMLAGRSLPLWLGVLTMCATWVGGGYINGTAQATYSLGLTWGLQAPVGYSISLILGGLFFARKMRSHRYATLVDPLENRFGKQLAGILMLAAVLSELIWSAAILVALGSTCATVIGLDLTTSIIVSAIVAIGYTITGGLWSVAYTDAAQLVLLALGLTIALPYAWHTGGGIEPISAAAATSHGVIGMSGTRELISYIDWTLLLILGGIPWNVYFQRVLATRDENVAVGLSVGGGVLCAIAAIPPLLLGLAARATDWSALANGPAGFGLEGGAEGVLSTLASNPTMVLPLQLRLAVPGWVGVVGLGAVAAAVMSSVDSSILSATSLFAWNGYRRLFRPQASTGEMVWLMRVAIVVIGAMATGLALWVPSVMDLWYLCSDVVYVMLFPSLVLALFDKKANRIGITLGVGLAVFLRLGGGIYIGGTYVVPAFLPYPDWTDPSNSLVAFPYRTLAAMSGLGIGALVSRLTTSIDPVRALEPVLEAK